MCMHTYDIACIAHLLGRGAHPSQKLPQSEKRQLLTMIKLMVHPS